MFLSKEDPWQGAKGITTWDLVPSHSPLLPESQACSASLPNLAEWISLKRSWEHEGRGKSVVSLTKSPPVCSVVIVGFPRLWWIWCSDDFASWLRHDEWITVFLRKPHFQEEPERMGGEKPYVWWNLLYVWWCINRMIHKLCFFQECSSKRPISSGKSQQFQCGFKIKMLN